MKHIKIYEDFNRQLKIGDFVVLKDDMDMMIYRGFKIKKDEIGQLYHIIGTHYWFNFNGKKTRLDLKDILYWSDNKEELEAKINAIKYNI